MAEGIKYDTGKLRLDLVPAEAIEAIGSVLTGGAEKYGENTWQAVSINRYEAALLRHLMAYKKGEKIDPDSGNPHLWHVLTNAAFMVCLEQWAGK